MAMRGSPRAVRAEIEATGSTSNKNIENKRRKRRSRNQISAKIRTFEGFLFQIAERQETRCARPRASPDVVEMRCWADARGEALQYSTVYCTVDGCSSQPEPAPALLLAPAETWAARPSARPDSAGPRLPACRGTLVEQ